HISDPGLALPARLVEAGLRDGRTEGLGPGERLDAVSLHTTQHIVEMMDGDLTIAAGAGARGAEIAFTFLALPSASGDADRSLTGMQVLLVAADPMERRVLAMQTELWGAPSTPVAPEDAVELVSGDRVFDVALIEHRRPAVDGLAIAGAIRARRGQRGGAGDARQAGDAGEVARGAGAGRPAACRCCGAGGGTGGVRRDAEGAGRGRQQPQPEHAAAPDRTARSPGRRRLERPPGGRRAGPAGLRRAAHGRPDARDGRPHRRVGDRPALDAWRPAPAHRADRDGRTR